MRDYNFGMHGAGVFIDPGAPAAERYKMVYQFFPDQTEPVIPEYGTWPTMACAVSPDGLRWTVTAIPFVNRFVEQCSFIKHGDRYIVHSQNGWRSEGGGGSGRTGVAHVSYDFEHWPDYDKHPFRRLADGRLVREEDVPR